VTKRQTIAVVGAGFSGAVISRILADAGYTVRVFEGRHHVAGNCHTELRADVGIYAHVYGPHIFHTKDLEVWDFVNSFLRFRPYVHRVKASHQGEVYSMPINLHTLNQFTRSAMTPTAARRWLEQQRASINNPENFEEQALAMMGEALYQAFFAGYTAKQWGRSPRDLPSSVLKRLPMRFSYDDNYFDHPYQGLPELGYTELVGRILDHKQISVSLNTKIRYEELRDFHHIFWSGPVDDFFDNDAGYLSYRTLDFDFELIEGDFQGCAQMNYVDEAIPFTRITQHNYLNFETVVERSLISREFSREWKPGDIPYYPIRLASDDQLLSQYLRRSEKLEKVTFVGRLGTYRYLDMDVTIREAIDVARNFLAS